MSASDIISQIPSKYKEAKESGELLYFPSSLVTHRDPQTDLEFQIRVCPAIQNKPQQPVSPLPTLQAQDAGSQAGSDEGKKSDPFAPPYNTHLFVSELKDENSGEEYVILLNKFSVVPQHFLLVSKEYSLQSSPLLPPDLVQTYKILVAARKAGKKFVAFYNCGEYSGASQAHKHIQFLPIDEAEAGPPIERLAKSINVGSPTRPFTISQLPHANHVFRLPADLQSERDEILEQTLANTFLSLLDLVISTIRHSADYPTGRPSYNVIITLEHVHLIPRRRAACILESGSKININALGFAGMLLVKSEEELEAVKKEGIGKMLREAGLESVHEVQVAGTTDEALNFTSSNM